MQKPKSVHIDLGFIQKGLKIEITERKENTLFEIEDASEHGEAYVQLKEGCFYDYEIIYKDYPKLFELAKSDFIKPFIRKPQLGTIAPNIYVGTLTLDVFNCETEEIIGEFSIEVRSVKTEYREDYRNMIEDITERCTDLIMQIDSPVTQNFETDFETDNETLYQRFTFVRSLIDSKEFRESIQKIITNPSTSWAQFTEEKDIRSIKRFSNKGIKQIASRSNRIKLDSAHHLNKTYGLQSIPTKIETFTKTETVDNAENRFIKHALTVFKFFCESCELKFTKHTKAQLEAKALTKQLSNLLNQNFFKDISRPTTLKLNSPVLQRKSGYREVLNAWMKFDLAAKLVWHGGENVYKAGKKDIAKLYEYWLFFTLLDLLESVFKIEPKSIKQLITQDKKGIGINLKQGNCVALDGTYESESRKLKIQFSFNRSFGGGKKYPLAGSYTTTLRPDYTLSIWPSSLTQKGAELKEMITHIHFDAKYKVNNFYDLITSSKDDELTEEENNNLIQEEEEELKSGTFKNQDLLKMHAYKDAIRRTGGAYVLYPGEGKDEPFRGFHELIPGLGAFVIKPNKDEKDKKALRSFILKVVDHFNDRASQREKAAIKIHQIHQNKKDDTNILKEPFPEYVDNKRIIPDETFVIVGYYKDKAQYNWIKSAKKYNFRMGSGNGSLVLDEEAVKARYLLLHTEKEQDSNDLWEITSRGPKVYSRKNLEKKGYPKSKSRDEENRNYLVYEIKQVDISTFGNMRFNFKQLKNYKPHRQSANPITTTITELINCRTLL
jgi:hypothetical protein